MEGKVVYEQQYSAQKEVTLRPTVASGNYILILSSGDKKLTRTITIE
jgi:hypothetical protein